MKHSKSNSDSRSLASSRACPAIYSARKARLHSERHTPNTNLHTHSELDLEVCVCAHWLLYSRRPGGSQNDKSFIMKLVICPCVPACVSLVRLYASLFCGRMSSEYMSSECAVQNCARCTNTRNENVLVETKLKLNAGYSGGLPALPCRRCPL